MRPHFKKEYYLSIILFPTLILIYPVLIYVVKLINSGYSNNVAPSLVLSIRIQQIFPMAVVGIFFVWFLIKKKELNFSYFYEKLLFLFIPLAVIGFLVGLLNRNNLFYNLGDSYSLAIVPIIYFVGMSFYSKDLNVEAVFKYLAYAFLIFSFIDLGFQIFNFIYFKKIIYLSFFNYPLPFAYFLTLENKKKTHYFLISALIISAVITLKRSNWLMLLLISVFAFLLSKNKRRILIDFIKTALAVVTMCAIIFIIFKPIFLNQVIPSLSERVQNTLNPDLSIQERFKEVITIKKQFFSEGGIGAYLIGFGNGAVYKMKYYQGQKEGSYYQEGSPDTVHTMHNSWAAFFFRTGVVGLLLFLLFCFSVGISQWKHIKNIRSNKEQIFYLKVLFILIFLRIFIEPFSSYVFWQDIVFGAMLTAAGYLMRRLDEVNAETH